MSTTTKSDLVKEVVKRTGCKKALAKEGVDSLFVALRESLMAGTRIEIRNFGVWTVKRTNPKPNARNPRTGETIFVPARRKVHFKPGRRLKVAMMEPIGE